MKRRTFLKGILYTSALPLIGAPMYRNTFELTQRREELRRFDDYSDVGEQIAKVWNTNRIKFYEHRVFAELNA